MEEFGDIQFLDYVVKAIVGLPEEVKITRTIDEKGVLLSVKVARDDMGKLIGKDGKMAGAIRSLLKLIGSKNNLNLRMMILEPD
jgi:hypothetical protein